MPKPLRDKDGNLKETRKEFIKRCVPIVIEENTAKDGKQGTAICYSIWEEDLKETRKKKSK